MSELTKVLDIKTACVEGQDRLNLNAPGPAFTKVLTAVKKIRTLQGKTGTVDPTLTTIDAMVAYIEASEEAADTAINALEAEADGLDFVTVDEDGMVFESEGSGSGE
jgi:hypothetical protein